MDFTEDEMDIEFGEDVDNEWGLEIEWGYNFIFLKAESESVPKFINAERILL
jgi:hypothetical protein